MMNEQEHHAQLGHGGDGLRIPHQAEARRADDDACGEVAQHRAQAEKPEQGTATTAAPQKVRMGGRKLTWEAVDRHDGIGRDED